MMTKRDYSLIATAILDVREDTQAYPYKDEATREAAQMAITRVAHSIAVSLREMNRRFDISRFMRACDLQDIPDNTDALAKGGE